MWFGFVIKFKFKLYECFKFVTKYQGEEYFKYENKNKNGIGSSNLFEKRKGNLY